ncbi:MAG: hypothetical protein ACKVY0_20905 [Prosthecobacter sp.]|uniref:hypothetical protein n=1 Tax=Prosthecobacter sp. TaxID=1965333 RepID=UPI0039010111
MSTLAEIEIAAAGLPAAEKRSLLSWLKAELSVENQANAEGSRVSGLGKGKWQVADDFDAPLPDEFWLGRDA